MAENGLKKRLMHNSFWSLVYTTSAKFGALLFTIILARFLAPDDYGVYVLALSIAMLFNTFTDLGINQALIRYVSSALYKNKKKIPAYYWYLLKIKVILTLFFAVLLFILAYPISVYFFKNSGIFLPLLISTTYLFMLSLESFHSMIFYSIEKTKYLAIREFSAQILRIILVFLVFFFVSSPYVIAGIFIALSLTRFLILLFIVFFLKRKFSIIYQKPSVSINKSKVFQFVKFLTIAGISSVFFSYIDSIMLGFFLKPEYVGYYRAAFSLVLGIIGLIAFPNLILLPVFTKLEKSRTSLIASKVSKYINALAIPASFGLLILGRFFIRLFYGYPYLNAVYSFNFLSFLILPSVGLGVLLAIFSAKEKPQIFAKLIIMISILNILLNFVFIKCLIKISPLWATSGAAIATLISWWIYYFLAIYIAKKQFKFNMPLSYLLKPLIASLIMSGVLISFNISAGMTFIKGVVMVLLGLLIYFAVMILIKGFKKEDFELVKLFFKKKESLRI